MSKQVQFRRGTTSDHASFTGAVGEITVNTTTHQLVSHDGVNAGGFAQALAGANTDITSLALNQTGLKIKGASANKLNIKPNETLSAERVLNVTVNDANRALAINGDATLSGNTVVQSGTWTPVLTFATPGNLSVVYTIQVGFYYAIGNLVFLQFGIVTSTFTHTTASGDMNITGLPFTSKNGTNQSSYGPLSWRGITKNNYTQWSAVLASNAALITATGAGSGQATVALGASDMPTGGTVRLQGSIVYEKA